jgi:hypothetical protein
MPHSCDALVDWQKHSFDLIQSIPGKGETEGRFIAENMSFKEHGLTSPIVL